MANIKINGITYSGVDSIKIPNASGSGQTTFSIPPTTQTKPATPSTTQQTITPDDGKLLSAVIVDAIPAKYGDSTNATATASQILSGKKAVIKNSSGNAELATGTMTNRGAVAGTINTKTGTYTIPAGYHDGTGTVGISSTEQNKITKYNIRSGVTILGVSGEYGGGTSISTQDKTASLQFSSSSTAPAVINPDTGYDAMTSVTINYPNNLSANNIKHGITILGVAGSYQGDLEQRTADPSFTSQPITPSAGNTGISSITINAIPSGDSAKSWATANDIIVGKKVVVPTSSTNNTPTVIYGQYSGGGGGGGGGGLPTTIVAGDTPIWADINHYRDSSTTGSTATSYTIKRTGTYRIKASFSASSQTASASIRRNGTVIRNVTSTSWSGASNMNYANLNFDYSLTEGDIVSTFITGNSSGLTARYAFCNAFALCIEWNTGLN